MDIDTQLQMVLHTQSLMLHKESFPIKLYHNSSLFKPFFFIYLLLCLFIHFPSLLLFLFPLLFPSAAFPLFFSGAVLSAF